MLRLALTLLLLATGRQHSPADQGVMVMGFDQEKTVHHFYLHEDGGTIDVAVADAANAADRDAIRSHLRHIATMFGEGDFNAPMLVHNARDVPGTATLAQLKGTVTYTYRETPNGGRVDIVSRDEAAVAAVHDFLRYQIREHRTGDTESVAPRK